MLYILLRFRIFGSLKKTLAPANLLVIRYPSDLEIAGSIPAGFKINHPSQRPFTRPNEGFIACTLWYALDPWPNG